MNMKNAPNSPARQDGAATLFVALILLFSVTVLVFLSSKAVITEIGLSANEVRAKQSHAEAQGALDYALAYINDPPSPNTYVAGATLSTSTLGRAIYLAPGATPDPCPDTPGNLSGSAIAPLDATTALIFACGWSDDSSARQHVMQLAATAPGLPGPVNNPLIAKGTVNVTTGTATVINYYNNITIWMGQEPLKTNSGNFANTSTTLIRNPTESIPVRDAEGNWPAAPSYGNAQCNNPPGGYICTSQGAIFGPDVVYSDTNLSSLTNAEYFKNFFGMTLETYESKMADTSLTSATADQAVGKTGEILWIEGDMALNTGTIGSEDDPVILIVNGDMEIGGSLVIHGVVYVNGDLKKGVGNPDIFGSLIVAGDVDMTGNLKVIYSPNAVNRARNLGASGTIAGSWRDWLGN